MTEAETTTAEETLSIVQASEEFGVHQVTLRRGIHNGRLPAKMTHDRYAQWRMRRGDLEVFMKRLRSPSVDFNVSLSVRMSDWAAIQDAARKEGMAPADFMISTAVDRALAINLPS